MTETAAPTTDATHDEHVSSFAKGLALGRIHEDLVFPYPIPRGDEEQKVRDLIAAFRDYTSENLDSERIDRDGDIPRQVFRDLGELGMLGLYVPEQYGGQGLSQTGYSRLFEAFAGFDGSLTIALGVHQSIGYKAIAIFGSDEQKARFLPDLVSGEKLAGYALTEPTAGSDAHNIKSRAVQQPDGSWVLNGEKRYIGNGDRGDVFTTFARCEVDGEDRHIALIVERDMIIEIVKPKERTRETVGVGAKGDAREEGSSTDPNADAAPDLPDEPEVLPDVPDAPPAPEDAE